MQTTLKRHQKVKLLIDPEEDYVEPYADPPVKIKKGMVGKINIVLPNGKYHVKIEDKNGDELAYVVMEEDYLEAID